MFFRDAESYNRSILREEKQGGRKDEIKKNNGTITCRMHGGITCSLWKRRREKECKKGGDGPVEIDYATFMVGTHQSAEAEKR